MNGFTFKKIPNTDKEQVQNLVNTVFKTLENPDFLIPWTNEQMNRFFNEDYSILFGAYDGDLLIAMTQIFTPREIEEEYYDILNIPKTNTICELGGFLVLPEYRKKKVMTHLSKIAYDYFKQLDFDYVICTCHPENIVSNKVAKNLEFKFYGTLTTQSGFLRSLYYKENDKIK